MVLCNQFCVGAGVGDKDENAEDLKRIPW